jgi:hypothetical protein
VLVYAVAVVAALAIPALTRGSYSRMFDTKWRFGGVLFAGLAIQIALEYVTIPKEHWHDVGFGLLVASYVLILAFAARNLVIRGMGIVLIGIACNALVITLNQGMPFKIPPGAENESWVQPSVKHHPQQPDDKLRFLSDIIVLNGPFESVLSFGDLILIVGLCDVAYNTSRKPKRRGTGPPNPRQPRRLRRSKRAQPIDLEQLEAAAQDDEPTRSRSTRSSAMTTRSS